MHSSHGREGKISTLPAQAVTVSVTDHQANTTERASPQSKANLLTVRLRTHATSNVDTALDDLSPPTPPAGASPGSHVLLVGQHN